MLKRNSFFVFLLLIILVNSIIFWPFLIKKQVPFSANLLVSFYNPWSKEKFQEWENGIPNKPIGNDDLRIFYPQRDFTLEMIKQKQLPLWNPYSFSGNYHLGLSESAVFYPLFFLFLAMPQLTAWIILIMIQPVLVGIGMFLFLKKIFKDFRPALFGSIVFAFSGVVVTRMVEGISVGHTLLWLPYVLYGIESYLETKKFRYLIVTLFSLIFSLLAGWFQFTFYILVFSFFYLIYKIKTLNILNSKVFRFEKWLLFIPFLLLPLLTFFHTLPALDAFFDSPRGDVSENAIRALHLMPFQHLLTFLIPDLWGNPASYNFFGKSTYKESILYIGIVPFITSLFSFSKFKIDKNIRFFLISVFVTLFLGIDSIISNLFLSLPIPIVSSFLPNRIFYITSFSFCVLAAFGMDTLLKKEKTFDKKRLFFP